MKFVHIADVHFDCPFSSLSVRENLSDNRRLGQRNVFRKVIEYIKDNDIDYLFIAGDLYETEYVRKSTINYINSLFLEIPNTKIFISPGNHDPFLKNSYYNEFEFLKNVYIFKSTNFECKEYQDLNIYGMGFQDFYCKDVNYSSINVIKNEKPNILLMHSSLGSNEENREYNPVSENKLKELDMDYIALGHIHKPYYNLENYQKIVYPGSLVSLGFDELGPHGMIVRNV